MDMRIKNSNERGFSLIEIIVSLVIIGISTALAGMWIVSVVNGYVFAKTNASAVQKAQLAMTRLTKEFQAISAVTSATATAITYTRIDSTLSPVNATVSLSGSTLSLNGDTLTDGVNAFALTYCNAADSTGCPTAWSSSSKIIEISLTMTGGNNTQVNFVQRVAPRNL